MSLSSPVKRMMLGWVHGPTNFRLARASNAFHHAVQQMRGLTSSFALALGRGKKTYKDIAGQEELDLVARYQRGDRRAGEVLLQAHEGIIGQFAMRGRYRGLDDEDLLQEARIGFLKGAERYRPGTGASLVTYARWWMISTVESAIHEGGSLLYCPMSAKAHLRKAHAAGINTAEDMAEAGILRRDMAERALATFTTLLSLDAQSTSQVDGLSIADVLPDDRPLADEQYEEIDEEANHKAMVNKLMSLLTDRERVVVLARVGDKPESLTSLGARIGLSRERTRQVQLEAMEKLRNGAKKEIREKKKGEGEEEGDGIHKGHRGHRGHKEDRDRCEFHPISVLSVSSVPSVSSVNSCPDLISA